MKLLIVEDELTLQKALIKGFQKLGASPVRVNRHCSPLYPAWMFAQAAR